ASATLDPPNSNKQMRRLPMAVSFPEVLETPLRNAKPERRFVSSLNLLFRDHSGGCSWRAAMGSRTLARLRQRRAGKRLVFLRRLRIAERFRGQLGDAGGRLFTIVHVHSPSFP